MRNQGLDVEEGNKRSKRGNKKLKHSVELTLIRKITDVPSSS